MRRRSARQPGPQSDWTSAMPVLWGPAKAVPPPRRSCANLASSDPVPRSSCEVPSCLLRRPGAHRCDAHGICSCAELTLSALSPGLGMTLGPGKGRAEHVLTPVLSTRDVHFVESFDGYSGPFRSTPGRGFFSCVRSGLHARRIPFSAAMEVAAWPDQKCGI
jgi:hypothetical protein